MKQYRLGTAMWAAAALATGLAFADASPQTVSLLRSCDEQDALAALNAGAEVKVHFSLSGYSQLCYKVTANLGGQQVDGYVLGAALPAVRAFEAEARTHIPPLPPPPPDRVKVEATADPNKLKDPSKENLPALPTTFAGLRGTDTLGHPVDLSRMRAQNVVLYFWSPTDRSSVRKVESLEYINSQYRQNGFEIVGVASTRTNLQHIIQEHEINWPQLIDSGQLAAQHQVERDKPFLLLDGSRNVIAAAGSASDLEPAIREAIRQRKAGARR